MRTKRFSWLVGVALAMLSAMAVGSPAFGADECTTALLDGQYVFTARGFSIPTPPGPALPQAIVDLAPQDDACVGNVTFASTGNPSLNFVVSRKGDTMWLISNPNTVLQGTATKLLP